MIFRRMCVALAASACAVFAAPASAQASGKVIRIVVPFAAGGAREVLARTFYLELGTALGQTIIVENRPGAGGAHAHLRRVQPQHHRPARRAAGV